MKALIIRHGETDWNKQHLLQGTIDIPLNETGIAQAQAAAKALKDVHIDVAVCSPLKRAAKTAEVILKDRNIPIIYEPRLCERNFGTAEGGRMGAINFDLTWNFGEEAPYEGMESADALLARTSSALDDIYEKYRDKTVLIVTHGCVSICCGYYFMGEPKSGSVNEYFCQNCVVKEYTKGDDK